MYSVGDRIFRIGGKMERGLRGHQSSCRRVRLEGEEGEPGSLYHERLPWTTTEWDLVFTFA